MPARIICTYAVVTPESAEEGDCAETGFHPERDRDVEPDDYDEEEGLTRADLAVAHLESQGAVYPSASAFHVGVSYSDEGATDYRTGENTQYSYHLEGFAPAEEREIFARMTRR